MPLYLTVKKLVDAALAKWPSEQVKRQAQRDMIKKTRGIFLQDWSPESNHKKNTVQSQVEEGMP